MPEVNCQIIASDVKPGHCARIAIADNAMQRDLNLLEQANAIALLSQDYTDNGVLVQAANECGLSVNRDMVEKLLKIVEMSQQLRQALLDGAIALPVALKIVEMDDPTQSDALVQLLCELKLGLNRQREIMDWILAVTKRDGVNIIQVLESGKLHDLRNDLKMDASHKRQIIRNYIKRLRYPTIAKHEILHANTLAS